MTAMTDRATGHGSAAPAAAGAPELLTMDLRRSYICVRPENAVFSWAPGNGWGTARQISYELKVYGGDSLSDIVYDSGVIACGTTCGIRPPGLAEALTAAASGRLLRWSVVVLLSDGRRSAEADGNYFSVRTAGDDSSDFFLPPLWAKNAPCFAFFRKYFTVPEGTARAIAFATALSPEPARQFVYNLYVNGTEISVGPPRLDRDPSSGGADDILYYGAFDFTEALKPAQGEVNTISALCHTAEGKAFGAQVVFYDRAGFEKGRFDTGDGSWEAMDADPVFRPSGSAGTHYYSAYASNIDMTARRDAYEQPEYRKGAFGGMRLTPARTPAVKRYPRNAAVVRRLGNAKEGGGIAAGNAGGCAYFIDLGREIVGGVRIVIRAGAATDIEAGFGEELLPDGTVRCEMRTGNRYRECWTVPGGLCTVETPDLFTFRYVSLRSAGGFEVVSAYGLAVTAGLDTGASSLVSDNDTLLKLYDFTKYTVEVTTQDLFVDSQSRERGAYEGDMLINLAASIAFFREMAVPVFSFEYLLSHRTWPAEYVLVMPTAALMIFMETGDKDFIRRVYPRLLSSGFLRLASPELGGLVRSGNAGAQGTDAVLYDWPPSERDGYDTNVKFSAVLNAMQIRALRDIARIAGCLGLEGDAYRFGRLAYYMAMGMIDRMYDERRGAFCDGIDGSSGRSEHFSQHASAFALYGLGPELLGEERTRAICGFLGGRGGIRMSVYGAYFLLDGLYRAGSAAAAAVANSLLLGNGTGASSGVCGGCEAGASSGGCCGNDPRSWVYMMDRLGATVTAEAWCPENKPNMTFSHPWGAAPAALIARGIFGIEPLEPGYARFRVNFRTAGINGSAGIVVPTVRGPVFASFDSASETYSVVCPPSTEAEVMICGRCVVKSASGRVSVSGPGLKSVSGPGLKSGM